MDVLHVTKNNVEVGLSDGNNNQMYTQVMNFKMTSAKKQTNEQTQAKINTTYTTCKFSSPSDHGHPCREAYYNLECLSL